MSLGTGVIKGWWGPCENTRLSMEVPLQPCEWEPALLAATNQYRHTEGTTVEKRTWPDTYREPLPMRCGKGWSLNWQNRRPKQWSTKLSNFPSKVVVHKDQGSRQLQVWQPELTCKHMARQALAATPQIIETAGCIGSRLTEPKLHLATLKHECRVLERRIGMNVYDRRSFSALLKQQRERPERAFMSNFSGLSRCCLSSAEKLRRSYTFTIARGRQSLKNKRTVCVLFNFIEL